MKEFKLSYNVKPVDLLFLGMLNIYKTMVGLINVIFTLSMVLLVFRYWSTGSLVIRILIALGILLCPIFQPLFIYIRSRKIVANMPKNIDMSINKNGIELVSEEHSNKIKLSDITNVSKVRKVIIIYTKSSGAFVLNNQTLNGRGQELYDFLKGGKSKNIK